MSNKLLGKIIALLFIICITLILIVNNIYYTIAFLIYSLFFITVGFIICLYVKIITKRYIKKAEIETKKIIESINQ